MSSSGAKSAAGKKPQPKNFACDHPGCGKKFMERRAVLIHSNVHTEVASYAKARAREFTDKLDILLSGPDPPPHCKIPLSHGYGCSAYTIISPERYDEVRHHTWCLNGNGYPMTNITDSSGKKTVYLHKTLVDTAEGEQVDHKDGNKLNNTGDNLRSVSRSLNARNCKQISTNTSGYTGVCFEKRRGKWMARIHIDGKNRHLGYFENTDAGKIAAAETFDMAVARLYPDDETVLINFKEKRPEYLRKLGFVTSDSE